MSDRFTFKVGSGTLYRISRNDDQGWVAYRLSPGRGVADAGYTTVLGSDESAAAFIVKQRGNSDWPFRCLEFDSRHPLAEHFRRKVNEVMGHSVYYWNLNFFSHIVIRPRSSTWFAPLKNWFLRLNEHVMFVDQDTLTVTIFPFVEGTIRIAERAWRETVPKAFVSAILATCIARPALLVLGFLSPYALSPNALNCAAEKAFNSYADGPIQLCRDIFKLHGPGFEHSSAFRFTIEPTVTTEACINIRPLLYDGH